MFVARAVYPGSFEHAAVSICGSQSDELKILSKSKPRSLNLDINTSI